MISKSSKIIVLNAHEFNYLCIFNHWLTLHNNTEEYHILYSIVFTFVVFFFKF